MIADGCLDGVDRIFGMHVWPAFDTGKVGIVEGPTMAQPDTFNIEVQGVGGHAAGPDMTRDPIVAASQIINVAQQIVSRNTDPMKVPTM